MIENLFLSNSKIKTHNKPLKNERLTAAFSGALGDKGSRTI